MKIVELLSSRSRPFIAVTSLLLVVLLGFVNYLSGPEVSFLVFYTAPIILAAWFVGRRAGYVVCLASGLSWLVVAVVSAGHYAHPAIPYWNAAVTLGFMLILAATVSAFKGAHEHERELARTDYLTGAFNGRAFTEVAEAEINRARRHEHPFTVAFMDVDDFKQINDRFGHSTGDLLLRTVSETIRRSVRVVDVVARLGGDEFAVLLPETSDAAAQVVMRRVRRSLLEVARGRGWPVTFSIGVVTWDAPPASVDEMMRAADALMYAAKNHGKNNIQHRTSNAPATAA